MSPPRGPVSATHRLTSISFSHYCEVARFALTRAGVPFRESRYLPFFHMVPAALALRGVPARADKTSSARSTPILRCPDGRVVNNSVEILRYALPDLFGSEQVEADLQYLHDKVGPHTRRLAYGALLGDPAVLGELARRTVDPLQAAAFRAALPVVGGQLKKVFGIDAGGLQRSESVVREAADWADERLARHPFLSGDTLQATDLYFACMLAPAAVIGEHEGYGVWLPALEDTPPEYAANARALRERPAGRHALRMFREERAPRP
ncbi:MAG: glutathione S-transferase family protein [Myxococcales bacterium]|nr:glutathione S-transferase family protein [Myxococcales bacterium]